MLFVVDIAISAILGLYTLDLYCTQKESKTKVYINIV